MSWDPDDPARTHALLIGIESYEAGPDWDLDGPAQDVIAMYDWLRRHDVPARQIRALVSPLPKNVKALRGAIQDTTFATSEEISSALAGLHLEGGDLLVLFWAGHAAVQQAGGNVVQEQKYRLFTMDATTEVKRNFEWDALQAALASDYFSGFRHQILIVDACADRRKDFKYTTRGESLTSGAPLECEQFVMFAASAGETAKNLDDEQRGLFSRELLKALSAVEQGADPQDDPPAVQQPAAARRWPPNLKAVSDRVVEAFQRLRDTGKATQTPLITTNWGGVWQFPDPASASSPAPAQKTFALVIGVSKYWHPKPQGPEPDPAEFTDLEAAAQDAAEMHKFLSEQPGYVVLRPLLDEEATRANILQEIDTLRARCLKSGARDPVVEIFFSGHGARDEAGRSYLVPHDGRRRQLFATALWDETLDAALRQIPTRRLILFLDACHAGDFAAPRTKDAPAGFDPASLAGVAGDRRRFVVASSHGGQRSYEIPADAGQPSRGLFTSHLLQFLSGETTDPHVAAAADAFDDDQIELFKLFEALRTSVRTAAGHRFSEPQEPFANFSRPTGIFVPNRRLERRRRTHLEAVLQILPSVDPKAPVVGIESAVKDYLDSGIVPSGFGAFIACFEEGAREAVSDDLVGVYARKLLTLFRETNKAPTRGSGLKSPTPLPTGRTVGTPDPTTPGPKARPEPSPTPARPSSDDAGLLNPTVHRGAAGPGVSPVPPVVVPAAGPLDAGPAQTVVGATRRHLRAADVDYVLYSLRTFDDALPAHDAAYSRLRQALSDRLGITWREFDKLLHGIGKQPPPEWDRFVEEIRQRFDERWLAADQVASVSSIGIRSVGPGDA